MTDISAPATATSETLNPAPRTIFIQGAPTFYVPFSVEEIDLLIEISAHHYDAKCRAAGAPADPQFGEDRGFLLTWKMRAEYRQSPTYLAILSEEAYEPHPLDQAISATFSELDICLKIMERVRYLHRAQATKMVDGLSGLIRGALQKANDLHSVWKTGYTPDQTA